MTNSTALVLLLSLFLVVPAWAQTPQPDPVRLVVALSGVVLTSAGFALMLHQTTECRCGSDPGWLAAGVAVVGAGVTLTWLGLRERQAVIAPTLGPHTRGVVVTVRKHRMPHG